MTTESRLLFDAASQGDSDALGELISKHWPGLYAYVRLHAGQVIRSKESCADLVQSVCREVIQDLDHFEFRHEGGFRHWLYQTAQRKILDRARHWNRQKRQVGIEDPMPFQGDSGSGRIHEIYAQLSDPAESLIAQEQVDRLEAAFDRLSEDHRQVILLARVIGLPHAEVAASMGIEIGAVRVLLYRALARLAQLLGQESG